MTKDTRSAWSWIPTLYFAEGLPYVIVMTVSVIMYKRLGISNTDIALYTSWLYLPWVIKPLWSPIVDMLKTKRWWIVIMQLFIGVGLAGVAFTIPMSSFFQFTLAFFWLLAFSSATHDIAADGFYMLALDEHKQAYFVGIRSTFYRLAMITGQGLLIILAGSIETYTGMKPVEFSVTSVPESHAIVELPSIDKSKGLGDAFVVTEQELKVAYEGYAQENIEDLKKEVKQLNVENGFVIPEKEAVKKAPSRWKRYIADPLKDFLKETFNKDENENLATTKKGNIGIVGIKLGAQSSGDEVVLNISQKSGDKSIKLLSGERLTFTPDNFNKTAYVVVQLDPKLKKSNKATFIGRSGNIPLAWSITFMILVAMFAVFVVYHRFILPRSTSDVAASQNNSSLFGEFWETFVSFFEKEQIWVMLGFLLVYRLGESQLVKLAAPFLLDDRAVGGLGLTTGEVGIIYGTIGLLFLTIGGILGGWVASRNGLKYWLWWMTLAINLPNAVYVYLSYAAPDSFAVIATSVAIEQFGYGFGFTAYMLYMIYISEGKNKTAHFAICTGFMALGMMIPGMISGWLQEIIGYENFFIWVMLCTIPAFILVGLLRIDPEFGIKKKEA